MQQWEYLIALWTGDGGMRRTEFLNLHGMDGWELVHAEPVIEGEYTNEQTFIFKRPKVLAHVTTPT